MKLLIQNLVNYSLNTSICLHSIFVFFQHPINLICNEKNFQKSKTKLLKISLENMPPILEETRRKVMRLEIEKEALKKEVEQAQLQKEYKISYKMKPEDIMSFVSGLHNIQLDMIETVVEKKEREGFPEANVVINHIKKLK